MPALRALLTIGIAMPAISTMMPITTRISTSVKPPPLRVLSGRCVVVVKVVLIIILRGCLRSCHPEGSGSDLRDLGIERCSSSRDSWSTRCASARRYRSPRNDKRLLGHVLRALSFEDNRPVRSRRDVAEVRDVVGRPVHAVGAGADQDVGVLLAR